MNQSNSPATALSSQDSPAQRQKPSRILLVRRGSLGNCLLTLPLTMAIRRRFPHAHLSWATNSHLVDILKSAAPIDDWIALESGNCQSPRALLAKVRQLREPDFDLVIDTEGTIGSGLISWLTAAPHRVGIMSPSGGPGRWFYHQVVKAHQNVPTASALALSDALGAQVDCCTWEPTSSAASRNAVSQFVRNYHLGCGFVVMSPACFPTANQWPTKRFGTLARYLGQLDGLTTVAMWSSEAERKLAMTVVKNSGGHALLAPRFCLDDLTNVVSRAKLVISYEPGILWFAERCRTIGINLSPCEITGTPLESVQNLTAASPANADRPLQKITVESAYEACSRHLGQAESAAA